MQVPGLGWGSVKPALHGQVLPFVGVALHMESGLQPVAAAQCLFSHILSSVLLTHCTEPSLHSAHCAPSQPDAHAVGLDH